MLSLSQEEKELYKAMKMLINNDMLLSKYEDKALSRVKDFSPTSICNEWVNVIERLNE